MTELILLSYRWISTLCLCLRYFRQSPFLKYVYNFFVLIQFCIILEVHYSTIMKIIVKILLIASVIGILGKRAYYSHHTSFSYTPPPPIDKSFSPIFVGKTIGKNFSPILVVQTNCFGRANLSNSFNLFLPNYTGSHLMCTF